LQPFLLTFPEADLTYYFEFNILNLGSDDQTACLTAD